MSTAVFDALLADIDETYDRYGPARPLDRARFAIPQAQWTAIAAAMTDRAEAWGSGIELGLELGNVMPCAYDDPTITAPKLTPGERPHVLRLHISEEAADEIAACEAHLQALADTYGPGSAEHHHASTSWRQQLAGLLSTPRGGTRTFVHRDGPLALRASTETGVTFGVVFHGAPRRCTTAGCHATADDATRWRTADNVAAVLDHAHEPSFPFDGPQPGYWSLRP